MNEDICEFLVDKEKILECARKIYEKSKKAKLFSYEDVKMNRFKEIKGVYLFVDFNEEKKLVRRIIRIGTHTQNNYIHSRLYAHFFGNNSNSIFRKMLFEVLEKKNKSNIQNKTVSDEIRKYKFVVIDTGNVEKTVRLEIESKIIATLSWAALISSEFRFNAEESLFTYADDRTRLFGLWLKNGLLEEPYKNIDEVEKLKFMTV